MVNQVIDLSHHNTIASGGFHQIVNAGIVGVIHKATQGKSYFDPTYPEHELRARSVGLLWGAYHFGTNGDGVAQADFFLTKVDATNTLLALDFETDGATGKTMTVAQAEAFVQRIHEKTGKWPGFYSGNTIVAALGKKKSTILSNCWLWSARYGPKPTVQATWSRWTMWQYTDGMAGSNPKTVPGVGPCDRDKFNGTAEELIAFWNANT